MKNNYLGKAMAKAVYIVGGAFLLLVLAVYGLGWLLQ